MLAVTIINAVNLAIASYYDLYNKKTIPSSFLYAWLIISTVVYVVCGGLLLDLLINFFFSFFIFQFFEIVFKLGEGDAYSLFIIGSTQGVIFSEYVLLIAYLLSFSYYLPRILKAKNKKKILKKKIAFFPFLLASYLILTLIYL